MSQSHDDQHQQKILAKFSVPVLPKGLRFRKAAEEFARTNLISTVIVGLMVSWFAISWIVYRFEYKAAGANIVSFQDAIWWGIVTAMTVGYGDRYPITPEGRLWGGGLMLVGVFGVAIITSKISSYFLEQALREGKGMVNTAKLKDHFVICGWKEDMHELLTHILDFNPTLTSADLVLIANLQQAEIDSLKENPHLKDLKVIVGEYHQAVNLARAAPERARKVMILADRTPQANGQVLSMTEVDARTIMTAMTLSSLARGTLVTAELLDPKMDQYLKLASVSEIIYSREYSRLLLGNAAGGTGVTNVIFDLLDPKTPTSVTTKTIPEDCVNQPYLEFKMTYEAMNPGCVVIGVLENTGNSHRIKELALRQAQKTPDMGKLVSNLRSIKEIRCNKPYFNPGTGYKIPEGSMAIVVETRAAKGDKGAGSKELRDLSA